MVTNQKPETVQEKEKRVEFIRNAMAKDRPLREKWEKQRKPTVEHLSVEDPCTLCGLTEFCHPCKLGKPLTERRAAAKANQEYAQHNRRKWTKKQYVSELSRLAKWLPPSSSYLQAVQNEMDKKFP